MAHGVLRSLLSRYTGRDARTLRFTVSPYGKPELEGEVGLRFNLSHSRGCAVYVVARNRRVGVDIEWIDPAVDALGIAGRYFSPAECAAIRSNAPELRMKAFYAYWTCKEAYVKARGVGLSCDLRTFTVSLDSRSSAIVEAAHRRTRAESWFVGAFPCEPCYACAVAVEGSFVRTTSFDWTHG